MIEMHNIYPCGYQRNLSTSGKQCDKHFAVLDHMTSHDPKLTSNDLK